MSSLNDKELRVLDEIARNSSISQRELAVATGVSLGLINVILKKFLKTGYLQVTHLNKRKLEYLLTPKGFMAVARKTYHFATRTIRDYQQLQNQLSILLSELCDSGIAYFSIHGDGELRELIQSIGPNIFKNHESVFGEEFRDDPRAVILNVTADKLGLEHKGHIVSVLDWIKTKYDRNQISGTSAGHEEGVK